MLCTFFANHRQGRWSLIKLFEEKDGKATIFRNRAIYFIALFTCLNLLLAGCGSDNSGPQSFSIPIENQYEDLLFDSQEKEIAEAIEQVNLYSYRATVLINSTLFVDFERTPPDIIAARALAAQTAIDDLILVSANLIDLENRYITPAVERAIAYKILTKNFANDKILPKKITGDLYHARKLVDLYMNDDSFYKKYKLSDIARRTGVSMTRLRMMMEQVQYEIETAGYIDIDEQYVKAVRNCKAIRDTAITAEGVLISVATGGAGAAGTLTTVQKTVQVIETANTVLSVAESGVNVVNAAIGTDEIPPVIDAVFKGNKAVSYLLLPKSLSAKDVSSVIALTGPIDDATDWYFNVSTDSGKVEASTEPKDPKSKARHKERQETLDDFLLPGDYQLPKKQIVAPNMDNSGFSFVEEPTSDDDFILDALNMADLWDLPNAPQDNLSWDTESVNPDNSMEHASSQGPDADENPLAGDSLIFDPKLADPPAVTVIANPAWGDIPLIVTFSASVENPSGEALTYTWHFGDGGYEKGALSNPDHTYTEAGNFRVTVYVDGALLGKLMGATSVKPVTGAEPDGDDNPDVPDDFVCDGECVYETFLGVCINSENFCYCQTYATYSEYNSRECQSLCWESGPRYISEGCQNTAEGSDCHCRLKTPQELCTGTCGPNSLTKCIGAYEDAYEVWICRCNGSERIPMTCDEYCLAVNGKNTTGALCHPDSATDQSDSCSCDQAMQP